ncbi:MAG: hypothetical protein J5518_06725 [Lachnospiraceae bacterium]|nr:hypothetical protein [Lachnospiraceae bacterium]
MKYILQIHAGAWHESQYRAGQIIDRLREILTFLPVEKVLTGWTLDPMLYDEIGSFLHAQGIELFLWLPVFSETDLLLPVEPAKDIFGKEIGTPKINDGAAFTFCCPSSVKNLDQTKQIYETYFAACPFDGVFLDRIRTQSFVSGIRGVLSCGCKTCSDLYERRGVSLKETAKHYTGAGDRFFDVSADFPNDGYAFTDPYAAAFFQAKASVISESVRSLCTYFHEKGLGVGLDLFAPFLASFVGQDYRELGHQADFIKPMLYRRTDAPAGLGYEYRQLRKSIKTAEGYREIDMDDTFLCSQLTAIADLPCKKYPGIEVNRDEYTVKTDSSYIRDSLALFRDHGMDGAVLSWDVMRAPDEHLKFTNI